MVFLLVIDCGRGSRVNAAGLLCGATKDVGVGFRPIPAASTLMSASDPLRTLARPLIGSCFWRSDRMIEFVLGWISGGLSWKGTILLIIGIVAVAVAALMVAAL